MTVQPPPLDQESEQVPRALIVEDDPLLRLHIAQFMAREGYQTLTADRGQTAVERFAESAADIVLLEAGMPAMTGFDICRRIRQLPHGAQVPIVMITAYEDAESIDRSFEAGATEHITKPIVWAILRNRSQRLVRSVRTEQRLRNDWAFFQSLVDAIPDPTVVIDRDGVIRWANAPSGVCMLIDEPVILQPLALSPATQVIVPTTRRATDCDTDQLLAQLRMRVSTSNAPIDILLRCRAADGGDYFAELHGRTLRGINGTNFGLILRFQDVTHREVEKRHLDSEVRRVGKLAETDQLTGLANRRLFAQRMREGLHAAALQHRRLALMYIDLDGFKAINDSLGHAAGDHVLQVIAERMAKAVRDVDTIARIGGDEFAALITDIRQDASLAMLGQRVLDAISASIALAGKRYQIGASIGISIYPEHGTTAAVLTQRADEAMYAVKRAGKNAVGFAKPKPG
jgi:diguanylate cyclase (GGDEF)-like protein